MSKYELRYADIGSAKSKFISGAQSVYTTKPKLNMAYIQLQGEDSAVVREVRKQIIGLLGTLENQAHNIGELNATLAKVMELTVAAEQKACINIAGIGLAVARVWAEIENARKRDWCVRWGSLVPIGIATGALVAAINAIVKWMKEFWDKLFGEKPKIGIHLVPPPKDIFNKEPKNEIPPTPARPVSKEDVDAFVEQSLDSGKWKNKPTSGEYAGKGASRGIDVDNVYGAQCADISKAWYQKMYGKMVSISAWTEYPPPTPNVPTVNFPEQHTMDNVTGGPYMAGDIGFTITSSRGHTFVVISDQDAEGYVMILEQNPGVPSKRRMHVSEITDGFRKK